MQVSALYIYPVKSLGGISLQTAVVTTRGLQHDRRWMLVDEHNNFLTQREHPTLALFKTAIVNDSITIFHSNNENDQIKLPLSPAPAPTIMVNIWEDNCEGQPATTTINEWFSSKLSIKCKAVYMPETSQRKIDPAYSIHENDVTGFSDGYPVLLIGQASLDDLNRRLETPLPMNRFRPGIVFTGGEPFREDSLKSFRINNVQFFGVKLCGRCVVTTTDQDTARRGKEPLKTLATYRTINNKICFGQNVIGSGTGVISVGDKLAVP